MEAFILAQTPRTPNVKLDPATSTYYIKGKSIPDNSIEFYEPVFDWFSEFLSNPPKEFVLHVALDYFNTSSAKCLIDIFKRFQEAHLTGNVAVEVIWEYEEGDEDMLDSGNDYKSSLKFPFTTKVRE